MNKKAGLEAWRHLLALIFPCINLLFDLNPAPWGDSAEPRCAEGDGDGTGMERVPPVFFLVTTYFLSSLS
jgi:hypothetical protein